MTVMKPFSEQIRNAIGDSGLSRYVLAQCAGISESALSRFMAGTNSMSLKTLDGIAHALGLQIQIGVSMIKQPQKKGRPKKKEIDVKSVKKMTKREWEMIATNVAKDANELNFHSRRGVYVVEGAGVAYYDNNPIATPRENDPREKLIAEIRAFLKRSKLRERASAFWPVNGESKDYTFAMIIETDPVMLETIRIAIQGLVQVFARELREKK